MNTKLIERISLAAMLLIVMTIPAMAADCVFYFNTSDGSNEITLALDEEVVIYLDSHVPADPTGHEIAVVFNPNVVECMGVTENDTTDWMLWTDRGNYQFQDPDTTYRNFDALHFGGCPVPDGIAHCGDMTFKAVGVGETTLYLALYPEDNIDIDHETSIGNDEGEFDWVYGDATFVITVEGSSETFTKPLPVGWNLISLPLTATDNSVSAVLSTVSQNGVSQYDATTHQFEDATTMDPGVGYFVNVTTACTWEYEGAAYTSMTEDLSDGLNCVGWVNETGSALPGALSSIDGSYWYVSRWNANTQSYEVYTPGVPDVFNDFETMDRGEGYFISATNGCTLVYP